MQYFRFLPDPAKLRREARWSGASSVPDIGERVQPSADAAAGTVTIPEGSKVKSVREDRAEFQIEFEDGSGVTFLLADPGSPVAVRDKNNVVEYLGS